MADHATGTWPGVRAVLFDLDGTLVDHFDTLHACYRHAFETLGLPAPDAATVRRAVGGSMEVTMRKLLPPSAPIDEAARIWRARFDGTYLEDVRAMPGALALVERLHARGLALGVLTNKLGDASRGICLHLGFAPLLACVIGAGDIPFRKPQQPFSEYALRRLDATAAATILVGDSPYDIEAARVVGMRSACVATGSHTAPELAAAGADGVFADLPALGRAVFDAG